jgi:S-adenosyl methyltransferase
VLGADGGSDREAASESPGWAPEGIDVTTPNPARMYDYMLGGDHNFAIDREYAKRAEQVLPGVREIAHANRAFLGRAVRWLVGAGIRQFLDIGSGIPTLGNVHEVAERAAPEIRVMYVDIDPVAVTHTRAILAGNPRVRVLREDLRSPRRILNHPDVTGLLDFSQPISVMLVSVLHFIPESDDPYAIVGEFRDAVVAGSYIALSHATLTPEQAKAFETIRQMSQSSVPLQFRTREQIARLLTGLDIVEPGIVPTAHWHPDPDEVDSEYQMGMLAAVGRKP